MTNPSRFKGQLQAIMALVVLVIITIVLFIPIFIMGILKLFPNQEWRIFCTRIIDKIAVAWCRSIKFYIDKTQTVEWQVLGLQKPDINGWYLLVANHQTWLDIVVLLHTFTDVLPVLKYFIKDQLKWVPLLGFAWWAMGCPFMKRYSQEYLSKNPHKKGKDLLSAEKAMNLFQHSPATIVNFIEGTRFTPEKKKSQQSPYKNLLKPKAGGIAFAIESMNQKLTHLLDVSIVYPKPGVTLWDFLCHRIKKITIHIREIPIPSTKAQAEFREWLNAEWEIKDKIIDEIKSKAI
jgi:1-acyl-sn-glycerol-3-phosphate acyltransferase